MFTIIVIVITSLFAELPWAGYSEGTFWSLSQGATCLLHTVEASQYSFLFRNVKQESSEYQFFMVFWFDPTGNPTLVYRFSIRPFIHSTTLFLYIFSSSQLYLLPKLVFDLSNFHSRSYSCFCKSGWVGVRCEFKFDHCRSAPCVNGECESVGDRYRCDCFPGYDGINCEHEINECLSSPCM